MDSLLVSSCNIKVLSTYPLCVRRILSAMMGAISTVSSIPSQAATRSVWSMELVT
jgi:hypothetical protein